MNLTRRTWALSALALTLVLGACSTPEDLATPTLEPQFGTYQDDFGSDVIVTSNGNIAGLSKEEGYDYVYEQNFGEYVYTNYHKVLWSRYDNTGNLNGFVELDSFDCALEDYFGESCYLVVTPKSIVADSKGSSYALVSIAYSGSDYDSYYEQISYSVYKVDGSGNLIREINVGSYTNEWGGEAVDAAVDASGNIYVASVQTNSSGAKTNLVAKYSTTGGLVWQRTSTVGKPLSISVASNGNVFVGGSMGVSRLTSAGNVTWTKAGATTDVVTFGTNAVYARNLNTVRKLDANGKQLWSKAQSGLSSMVIADMTVDTNGNLYLAGKYSVSTSNRNPFTRKLNTSGGTVFTKTFGTAAYDDARGVATVTGAAIYLTGATQGSLAHPYRGGGNDGYVSKLNSSGATIWNR